MPPGSENKSTIRMITANADNTIHASTRVDLRSFRNQDTLLDVTIAGFGADKVRAPYIESEFAGIKTCGHEIKQIGDLVKSYDKELNPNAERDGFQAYFVVVSNGQTEKAGLPLEVREGKGEFLSVDGTTVAKLKEIIDTLPDNAELAIVWRRDVEKTKDVTYFDQFSAMPVSNKFELPKSCSCSANGKDVQLDDGLYLFTDKGEDRITFSSSIVSLVAITSDHMNWDAGVFPVLEYHTTQLDGQPNSGQRLAYLDGILTSTNEKIGIEYFKPDDPKPPPISVQMEAISTNNDGRNSQKFDLALDKQLAQATQFVFVPEEFTIIRLLMNPTERKLWGKMYGLPDEDDARAIARSDEFKSIIYVMDNNRNYPKDDYPPDGPPKSGPKFIDNSTRGFTMSDDNEMEFEKGQSSPPSKLMFSTLFEKQEDTQPEVDENRDGPDKFGMKVVIGDLGPKKKKTTKRPKDRRESALVPPKLLDLLNRSRKARKQKNKSEKEKRPNESTKRSEKQELSRILKDKNPKQKTNILSQKIKHPKIPNNKKAQRDIAAQPKKPEKKKKEVSFERPKVAKRDMVVLCGSPFGGVFRPSSAASITTQKNKTINKDYKLLWLLNKTGNKFKNRTSDRQLGGHNGR